MDHEEVYKLAVLNNRLLYYILEMLCSSHTEAKELYKFAYDSVYSEEERDGTKTK